MSDKISRRRLFQLSSGVAAAAFLPFPPAFATGGEPTTLTGDEALALLKTGNADFVANKHNHPDTGPKRRHALIEHQAPFCCVLSCSDSRVPPELLFNRGLGEMFTIRVAGNVYDPVALGSIEYAIAIVKVPLLVILGHENCGAVSAAVSAVQKGTIYPGSIGDVVDPIIPAVLAVQNKSGELLDNAIAENARRVATRLSASDPLIADPVKAGKLKVVSAVASLETGVVTFLD